MSKVGKAGVMLSSFLPIPTCTEYGVNKNGQVIRLQLGRPRARVGKRIKPRWASKGYLYVSLSRGSLGVTQRAVHCLVAEVFHGKCPAGAEVNHKDGIKSNNHYLNLEYVTPKQNSIHARDLGLTRPSGCKGEQMGNAKLTEAAVLSIRLSNESQRQLARRFNVSRRAIQFVQQGKTWTHV